MPNLEGSFEIEVKQTEGDIGDKFIVRFPRDLPSNAYVVIIDNHRRSLVLPLTLESLSINGEGQVNEITYGPVSGRESPGEVTHAMLVASRESNPREDDVKKFFPNPFLSTLPKTEPAH